VDASRVPTSWARQRASESCFVANPRSRHTAEQRFLYSSAAGSLDFTIRRLTSPSDPYISSAPSYAANGTISLSLPSALPLSKCVAALDARCPPAKNPMMPPRLGSTPNSLAFDRTVRIVCCASYSGTIGRPCGSRCSSTNGVMPLFSSHRAML